MEEHSRRAFVARSAAAVVSSLIPGRGPSDRFAAAQAHPKPETLAPMPVTCYLRHFSSKEGKSPSGQGEVWFVSGDPLSEAEAEVARSSGVKILEVHASGAGVLPAVSEVKPGVWNFAFLEEQVPLVRRLGMVPLVSFCTRFMTRWEYQDQQAPRAVLVDVGRRQRLQGPTFHLRKELADLFADRAVDEPSPS